MVLEPAEFSACLPGVSSSKVPYLEHLGSGI
jgi:hypothetical protein